MPRQKVGSNSGIVNLGSTTAISSCIRFARYAKAFDKSSVQYQNQSVAVLSL